MKTILATLAINCGENGNRYLECASKLIESYLKYTDFDILILTNETSFFDKFDTERLSVIDYSSIFNEPIISGGKFNMHLKRYPILLASKLDHDMIYFHDCDCYIENWDMGSYIEKCNEDFDVAFVSHARPQLGGLRRSEYKHFQEKIDKEFIGLYYDELDNAPNPAETRVLFRNNEKIDSFLSFWDSISKNNKNYFISFDGVYFGTCAVHSKMKMTGVTKSDKFTEFCRVNHGNRILNYFGVDI